MRIERLAKWTLGLALPLIFLAPMSALASGSRVDIEFRGGPGGYIHERARIWISKRKLRIEQFTPGLKRSKHVLIYRGDLDRFYSLNPERKTFVSVDRELIAAFGFEMKAARVEVDATLRRLPDDQHKMLERLLGARESGEAIVKHPVEVVPRKTTARVGRYTCRKMSLVRAKELVGEICVVDWSKIGVTRQDLEVFRKLANFQRELMGARDLTPLEIVPNQRLDLLVQFGGFPLYLKRRNGGRDQSLIRVIDIVPLGNAEAKFLVPKDYRPVSPLSLLVGEIPEPTPPARPAPAKRGGGSAASAPSR